MFTLGPRLRAGSSSQQEQYQTSLSNHPLLFTAAFYFLQNSDILKDKPQGSHMLPALPQRVLGLCLLFGAFSW